MKRLADGFAGERERLEGQWGRGEDVSTEDLRIALQRATAGSSSGCCRRRPDGYTGSLARTRGSRRVHIVSLLRDARLRIAHRQLTKPYAHLQPRCPRPLRGRAWRHTTTLLTGCSGPEISAGAAPR